MQFPQPRSSRPLPFFQAFLGEAVALPCVPIQGSVARNRLSEVALSSGVSGLLASILRDLSTQDEQRCCAWSVLRRRSPTSGCGARAFIGSGYC